MSQSTREASPIPRASVLDFATLVEALAAQQKLPASKIRATLRGLFALTAEGLKSGKAVRIRGLGVLKVREAPAAGERAGGSARGSGKRIVLAADKALKGAVEL